MGPTEGSSVRVALCDDVEPMRTALASIISADPEIAVCGSFGSGRDLLGALRFDPVDVLLLDVRMPDLDGPEVVERLSARPDAPRVLYLTSYPDQVPVWRHAHSCVVGAVTKDLPPADLLRTIHLAARGITLIAPAVAREQSRPSVEESCSSFALTEAERPVLLALCRGLSNEEIARVTHRSTSSVKKVLARAMERAHVRTRTELVLVLLRAPITRD